jgi:hypothetical protein
LSRIQLSNIGTAPANACPPQYKRIAGIRAGSGYLDLANDLGSVADFYEVPNVNAIVRHDPMHYRADDPAHARELAQQLFCGLGLAADVPNAASAFHASLLDVLRNEIPHGNRH